MGGAKMVTLDKTKFNRRTKAMQKQVRVDWAEFIRDSSKHLTADLSAKSAAGKPGGKTLSKKNAENVVRRDVNRSAKTLGSNTWKDTRIRKYIKTGDWPRLEAKLTNMNSSNSKIKRVQRRGLLKFSPTMHKSARNSGGAVPRSFDSFMTIPLDPQKKIYKDKKAAGVGQLRAGWWPAGHHLGQTRGFPKHVRRFGMSRGYFVDRTRNTSKPTFTMGNAAAGVNNPYFRRSFDWWAKARANKMQRAARKMIEELHKKFTAGRSLKNNYPGQSI